MLVRFLLLALMLSTPTLAAEGVRTDLSGETVLDVTQPKDMADRTHRFGRRYPNLAVTLSADWSCRRRPPAQYLTFVGLGSEEQSFQHLAITARSVQGFPCHRHKRARPDASASI